MQRPPEAAATSAVQQPRIAICDDWEQCALFSADWTDLQQLAELQFFTAPFGSTEEVARALADFDAVCLMRERTPFPRELIDQLPRLKRLLFTGERNAAVDIAHARSRGIEVSGTSSGPNKASTAEHTWALILAATRRVVSSMNTLRQGHWRPTEELAQYPLPDVLEGDRIGIIGLGAIGSRVARIAQGFGMDVVAWSQNLSAEHAARIGVRRVEKNELIATSKIVSLHLVLSDRSRHTIGPTEFSLMRRDAVLVNTSRSGLIDQASLTAALDAGRPAHAALDVFDQEPLPDGHPLLHHSNVTLTPHLGFVATPVMETFYRQLVADLTVWVQAIRHPDQHPQPAQSRSVSSGVTPNAIRNRDTML
jgi:phosphoglycerate dehydrogenase-like enzyme